MKTLARVLALAAISGSAPMSMALAAADAQPSPVSVAAADSPSMQKHVQAAASLARGDLQTPLFLCRADSLSVVKENALDGSKVWLDPTQAFDNLYYVGNRFVGVWVLRTSAGLILFDSSTSVDEAEQSLVPGLRKLGLDPADIKYVVVTHGHWDHFGGAAYLQDKYGAHIALSEGDWNLIEKQPAEGLERNNHPIPHRDVVVTDGQKLTLGDTTVTLYVTPGHTPGTISAILPVKEAGHTHVLSLYGSVAFPPTLAPTDHAGGLRLYDESVQRFAKISRAAGAEGILNTHVFADGTLERLVALKTRQPGAPNPFLTGADFTRRYYGVLHECLLAAELRPERTNDWKDAKDWTKPLAANPGPASAAHP
jgi:metallo-beta-lactamase class B